MLGILYTQPQQNQRTRNPHAVVKGPREGGGKSGMGLERDGRATWRRGDRGARG